MYKFDVVTPSIFLVVEAASFWVDDGILMFFDAEEAPVSAYAHGSWLSVTKRTDPDISLGNLSKEQAQAVLIKVSDLAIPSEPPIT